MEIIKEEKKADLEQLLNSLIEKGWKPFGALGKAKNGVYTNKYFFFEGCADGVTLRQLVSKESGLWQFVCENRMIKAIGSEIEIKNLNEGYGVVRDTDYQYRLIVSVLKYEDELEDFLIQNINVEGN